MVRDNTTDEALMKYFEWAESVHMGLGRFDPERARMDHHIDQSAWSGTVAAGRAH